MQSNQAENQSLEVLDEIIEDTKPLWISGLSHINQRSNLGGLKRDVIIAQTDF
jgi:hypothetical protein